MFNLSKRMHLAKTELRSSVEKYGLQPVLAFSPPDLVESTRRIGAGVTTLVENNDQLARWNLRKTFFDDKGNVIEVCQGYHHPDRFGRRLQEFMRKHCYMCGVRIKYDQRNSFCTAWPIASSIGESHVCTECADLYLSEMSMVEGDHVPQQVLHSYQKFFAPANEEFLDGTCKVVTYMWDAEAKWLRKRYAEELFPPQQVAEKRVMDAQKRFGKMLQSERMMVKERAKQQAQEAAKKLKREEENRKRREKRQKLKEQKRAELEKLKAQMTPEEKAAKEKKRREEANAKRRANRQQKKEQSEKIALLEKESKAKQEEAERLRSKLEQMEQQLLQRSQQPQVPSGDGDAVAPMQIDS